ncbi:MAG: hydrogenase subunit MbhD domain-containing protein [Thermodesulfobacteriota bacterium]
MLVLVIVCAVASITIRDLLGAAVVFGTYSFMMCLLWTAMAAVDVAFTEATIGAGISTVLMIAAVFRTTRRTKD